MLITLLSSYFIILLVQQTVICIICIFKSQFKKAYVFIKSIFDLSLFNK